MRALLTVACLLSITACDGERGPADAGAPVDSSSPVDSSAPLDGGDLPICPSPAPLEGSACTLGDGCQIPGSPCFFVLRCEDSMWSPQTLCPVLDAGP